MALDHGMGMGTSLAYDWLSVILTVVSLLLALIYLRRIIREYRMFHDVRAAVSLVKAIGLVVIAFGLSISAWGLVVQDSQFSVFGLLMARGALFVLLATLILVSTRDGDSTLT